MLEKTAVAGASAHRGILEHCTQFDWETRLKKLPRQDTVTLTHSKASQKG